MRVLLLEDDPLIGSAVEEHISARGDAVDWAQDIDSALHFSSVGKYDLILLDLSLPDGDGMSVLRSVRSKGDDVAIVILSARDGIADRIAGLNDGADDYLVKPFELAELDARISAVTRRLQGRARSVDIHGALQIEHATKSVTCAGQRVDITAKEWSVLERLARSRHATVAKSDIEEALYDFGTEIESNTVEVYISRLRKKLGKDRIRTIRGLGYQLTQEVD